MAKTTSTPTFDADKVVETLRDAVYISVGLGVIAFQKAQAATKDTVEQLSTFFAGNKPQLDEIKAMLEKSFADFESRVSALEAKFDEAVESFEAKLPDPAGEIVDKAHEMVKSARKQVRDLLNTAA